MADDVKDIAIYTGSEWTSLSELAAGVVDAKLPIESVDATVVVEGDASVFRVRSDNARRIQADTNVGLYGLSRVDTYVNNVSTFYCIEGKAVAQKQFIAGGSGGLSQSSPPYAFAGATDTGFFVVSPSGIIELRVSVNGAEKAIFSNDAFIVSNQIQTPSVRGLAGNDAEVTLGTNATLTANRVNLVSTENDWGTTLTVQSNLVQHKYGFVNGNEKHLVKETNGTFTDILDTVYVGLDSSYNDGFGTGPGSAFLNYKQGGLCTQAKNSIRILTPNGKVGDDAFSSGLYLRSTDNDGTDNPLVNINTKDVLMRLEDGQATLKRNATNPYVPTDSASIATKKIVDDKIWVGTTAQYLAIPIRDILPTTLYCLTD